MADIQIDDPRIVLAVGPAEPIRVPDSGYSVGSGYEALVFYASSNRITMK